MEIMFTLLLSLSTEACTQKINECLNIFLKSSLDEKVIKQEEDERFKLTNLDIHFSAYDCLKINLKVIKMVLKIN